MAHIGYGYGSEWHLLQHLGRSRAAFTQRIESLTGCSDIKWLDSYVTGDKLYCVYVAANEEIIREHGRLGGFPVNKISEVIHVIGPETAED